MKRTTDLLKLLLVAVLGGALALAGYAWLRPEQRSFQPNEVRFQASPTGKALAVYAPEGAVDFTSASAQALPAVVHIKSTNSDAGRSNQRMSPDEMFEFFFRGPQGGQRGRPRAASGSGVIISADGYIVTNNHVIDGASEIEVVLNDNRNYVAEVIGADGAYDIAVLKIKETNLPSLKFGNSDALQIGEWVLAVGNPFNLTSTVTAGIVSAKGRAIQILQDSLAVESFIQTDAAVNPGNSGGALINTRGELVGINTAIAGGMGGTYTGYSFAVPASLVSKVVEDLVNYGAVQRAFLGVNIGDVNAALAKERKLTTTQGVFVANVNAGSAAAAAGLQEGDVILRVNDVATNTTSQLMEQVSRRRPGDKVRLTYLRGSESRTVEVTLRNTGGTTTLARAEPRSEATGALNLGATLRPLSKEQLAHLRINNGVQVAAVASAGSFRTVGIREGFVITSISDQAVNSPEDVRTILEARRKAGRTGALVEGVYPDGRNVVYAITF